MQASNLDTTATKATTPPNAHKRREREGRGLGAPQDTYYGRGSGGPPFVCR